MAQDKISGFISLAGSTRPLEDLVLEQTRYILSLDGKPNEEAQKKIQEIEQQIANIKSPELSEKTTSKLLLGGPAKYWLDLRGYEPAKEAMKLRQPMLILQGERDYQVTMDRFCQLEKGIGIAKRRKLYFLSQAEPSFLEGKGKSTPAEYSTPGNVAEIVIDDIAKWIRGLK